MRCTIPGTPLVAYQSLYRKYRSQSFGDLVGQDHVVKALQAAVSRGRIAHSYLFTGPRGTGKTSTARLLAKALNCTGGPSAEPPEDCPVCAEITAGSCIDVVEMDAASESGVDNVREAIIEASEYQPAHCRYKVFIIDEVHDLSPKAFDALLKTIEEPPAHVIFILATTEYAKVPPTIRSRCQKYEFHRGTVKDLVDRLAHVCEKEGVGAEPAALHAIARMADGGYRDALTLLEQVLLSGEATVTLAQVYEQLGLVSDEVVDGLLQAVASAQVKEVIEQVDAVYRTGRDPRSIVESLLLRLADLTRVSLEISTGSDASVEAAMAATSARLGADRTLRLRSALAEAHRLIRDVTLPRQWLEAELIRIGASLTEAPAAPKPSVRGIPPGAGVPATSAAVAPRQPGKPSPPASDDPNELVWQKVVAEVSSRAKVAAIRLPRSRVGSSKGTDVTIEFDQRSDMEWVEASHDRQKGLVEAWARYAGWTPVLHYEVARNQAQAQAPGVETVAVELPLEGARLAEAVREVFGAVPADGGTRAADTK